MKNLIYLFIAILAVTAVSCGDDEPVIPRDRDITFSTFELFHMGSTTPSASLQQCDITIPYDENVTITGTKTGYIVEGTGSASP